MGSKMKEQAECSKFIVNDSVLDTEEFAEVYKPMPPSCYEVIRVIDGKPLFLDEHYARFVHTLKTVGQQMPFTMPELDEKIRNLAKINGVKNYNVRIIYNDFERNEGTVYLFFTHTSYPSEEMYRNGVKTDLLRMERKNPHAKIVNTDLRDTADRLMREEGLFEAILVNEENEVTEGSKSNVFFIKNGDVYTSPADGVLLGVTRQRILDLCKEGNISVHETAISVSELKDFQAAFISGTSPKVLPIACIGRQRMDVNDLTLRKIMSLYDEAIRNYLSRH